MGIYRQQSHADLAAGAIGIYQQSWLGKYCLEAILPSSPKTGGGI